MKSILQDKKECFFTGQSGRLHKHHVYGAANRSLSEKYGCWVWLSAEMHNMSNEGVHFNRDLDLRLKRICQRKFEEI